MKPYLHDANATNEDPTPGGPMTRRRSFPEAGRPKDVGPGHPGSHPNHPGGSSGEIPDAAVPVAAATPPLRECSAHKENLFTPNCIRTVGGRYINLLDPDPETFDIEDIAHALAHMPRFGGHLPVFYSVAEHSTSCRFLVPEKHAFAAIMHDASEAYLMDIPRPLKALIPQYSVIEHRFMERLSAKFGFEYPLHPAVKKADEAMLHREWNQLMLGRLQFKEQPLPCFTPAQAKRNFLEVFEMCKPK